MTERGEKTIVELFKLSILFKLLGSAGEMLAGVVIALIPADAVLRTALLLTQGDTDADIHDFLEQGFVNAAQWLSVSNGWVIGAYLFLRGLVQLVLVLALYRNKLWAYPGLLIVMGLFVVTQIYDLFLSHSIPTALLTLFDLVTMYLIWREYGVLKNARSNKNPF